MFPIHRSSARTISSLMIIGTISLCSMSTALAAQASEFLVELSTKETTTNTPIGVTITAVDRNGNIVTDYTEDLFIESDPSDGVSLPNGGSVKIKESDAGVGSFPNSIEISSAGTYTINVEGFFNQDIKGSATVTVKDESAPTSGNISFISPTKGDIISSLPLKIEGKTDIFQTIVSLNINGNEVESTMADDKGAFSFRVDELAEGDNKITLSILDFNGNNIGSNAIDVKYTKPTYVQSVEFDPATATTVNTPITVKATTDLTVSEAILRIDETEYTMTKEGVDTFATTISIANEGLYNVSIDVTTPNGKISQDNINTLDITAKKTTPQPTQPKPTPPAHQAAPDPIEGVQVIRNSTNGDIDLVRDPIDGVKTYEIQYGTDQNELTTSVTTTTAAHAITSTDMNTTYYAKIYGYDDTKLLAQSSVLTAAPNIGSPAPSCSVQGLTISPRIMDNQHYLTWSAVDGASQYTIYHSETPATSIDQMTALDSTAETKFAYSYNPHATTQIHEYFAVVATCADGTSKLIGNIEGVVVGPAQTLIIMSLFALMLGISYRWRRREAMG